ncbi:MAG: D-alanyl-D-alanine carboxypeptidase [Clostridia bacterium]|nr:D-alanyl-D-alanine carboxypeptidase [Clostridia bacterium]
MERIGSRLIRAAALSCALLSVFVLLSGSISGAEPTPPTVMNGGPSVLTGAVVSKPQTQFTDTSSELTSSDTSSDVTSSGTSSDAVSSLPVPSGENPSSSQSSSSSEPADEGYTVEAKYAGLFDADTLTPLYLKAADKKIYPASLTKLITACTALRYVSDDTVFTVGTELSLVKSGSSLSKIKKGQSLTLYELLCGMLISSGNDASYTVAVNVAREVSGDENMSDKDAVSLFVALMNKYAQEIGATDTNFVNPDGWDNKKQLTTVIDLAKIAAHSMKIPQISTIVAIPKMVKTFESGKPLTWKNTNLLIHSDSEYYLPEATGMKTGSTDSAGRCLIATVTLEGKKYITIVAGCKSDALRYTSTLALVDLLRPDPVPDTDKDGQSSSSQSNSSEE